MRKEGLGKSPDRMGRRHACEKLKKGLLKDSHVLVPGTCECNLTQPMTTTKGSCRCDSVKHPNIGRLSCIIQVGPKCHHKCPIRGTPRFDTHGGDGSVKTDGSRDWSDTATIQGMPGAAGKLKGQGMGSPLEPLRVPSAGLLTPRYQPSDTDFRLLASRTVRE